MNIKSSSEENQFFYSNSVIQHKLYHLSQSKKQSYSTVPCINFIII